MYKEVGHGFFPAQFPDHINEINGHVLFRSLHSIIIWLKYFQFFRKCLFNLSIKSNTFQRRKKKKQQLDFEYQAASKICLKTWNLFLQFNPVR